MEFRGENLEVFFGGFLKKTLPEGTMMTQEQWAALHDGRPWYQGAAFDENDD